MIQLKSKTLVASIFFGSVLLCSSNSQGQVTPKKIESNSGAMSSSDKKSISEWQLKPLSLYQVPGKKFLFEVVGDFSAGNVKVSSALETNKVETFGSDIYGEYGFTDSIAVRVGLGYLSGKEKNSLITSKIDGVKDIAATLKYTLNLPFAILFEAGVETALETLKSDSVTRTMTASSGGTKILMKGGMEYSTAKMTFGGLASYRHYLTREMDYTSAQGTQNTKVDGGHQAQILGFFEFGTGLRTGVELGWKYQTKSTIDLTTLTTTTNEFELDSQFLSAGGYLKVPAGDKILLYIKGDYTFNPNKKRGQYTYDQDEMFNAYVGLQSLF